MNTPSDQNLRSLRWFQYSRNTLVARMTADGACVIRLALSKRKAQDGKRYWRIEVLGRTVNRLVPGFDLSDEKRAISLATLEFESYVKELSRFVGVGFIGPTISGGGEGGNGS